VATPRATRRRGFRLPASASYENPQAPSATSSARARLSAFRLRRRLGFGWRF